MDKFQLKSKYNPAGDQLQAIAKLTENLNKKVRYQTLLGVTGSGKTFTMANVIANANRPTLVIAHNKTLAAQLADEFREFFPKNAVRYFVSYYDYYQPEAYIPNSDTYIEKDSSINDEIDRLRHSATQSLLTRKDVIIVASVSCIYGLGSPELYKNQAESLKVGQTIAISELAKILVNLQYERNDYELARGKFRIKGDTLEIYPSYENFSLRLEFFGHQIEKIYEINPISGKRDREIKEVDIYPAKHFITLFDQQSKAISEIRSDLKKRLHELEAQGKLVEAYRLKQKTTYDLEMLEQLGYVNGVENYSRYFDNRRPGQPPYTLIDYFPKDFLTIVDESHMTIPQIRGMYAGDQSRKTTLINFGFRLPSALDNRPLKYDEFENKIGQTVFLSATPAEFEIKKSSVENQIAHGGDVSRWEASPIHAVVEQLIRPTGLIDPEIEIRSTKNQIENLSAEIKNRVEKNERVLITTLTKKMAEALTEYLLTEGQKVQYLHSDVETIERTEILADLRSGKYDIVVGINLLREGLDLPEVSLVAILDADKEGFLRSEVSLVQTIGRAARHINGKVIMYADVETESMRKAILETNRRRVRQLEYNKTHHITPTSVMRAINRMERDSDQVEDQVREPKNAKEARLLMKKIREEMLEASGKLNFERAALLRDRIIELENSIRSH